MFKIFEQREPPIARPFRIIETTPTVDGPRDRITNQSFVTFAEASKWISDEATKRGRDR